MGDKEFNIIWDACRAVRDMKATYTLDREKMLATIHIGKVRLVFDKDGKFVEAK